MVHALQDNEEKLHQLVRTNSIPIIVIDNEHTITHWNKACECLTGLSAERMVGTKNQWMAFYLEERPILADLLVDEVSEDRIARYYTNNCNTSSLVEGAYNAEKFFPAVPLRNIEGKVIGALEMLYDCTERKRAEEQLTISLKEKEELLSEIHHVFGL